VTETRRIRRRDPSYPRLLAAIHDPPPRLYLRGAGDARLLDEPAVAVVGARACSSYGRSVARSLSRDLATSGLVVPSSMAIPDCLLKVKLPLATTNPKASTAT
jgi:DNA processing protein